MNKKILVIAASLLLFIGCASQPKKAEPKKLIPKDMNGTTTMTTQSDGTVYANQKENYLIACMQGDGQGCRNISTLYEKGFGVPKDTQKARYYVEKGCELNHGSSCNKAGNFYDYGLAGQIDKQKAASYYMKGCELNHSTACNNIGSAYMTGEGVVKNLSLSETYLNKALQLGYNAYNNLGFLSEMKGDDAKAEAYYTQGCNLKDATACTNLAGLYKEQKKYTKAYNQYIKACNLTNANACNAASIMIYKKLVNVPNANAAMFKLDSNSCEMNNKTGCANLAFDYEKGIGTPADTKKAKKFYKKACKLGDKNSCRK
jgi:TPR repeat protein